MNESTERFSDFGSGREQAQSKMIMDYTFQPVHVRFRMGNENEGIFRRLCWNLWASRVGQKLTFSPLLNG